MLEKLGAERCELSVLFDSLTMLRRGGRSCRAGSLQSDPYRIAIPDAPGRRYRAPDGG